MARCDPQAMLACQASCAESVSEYQESDIVAQPGAREGDLVRCPVSCVVVRARDENLVTYAGKDYFACCMGCASRLRAEPKRFLDAPNA